MRWMIVLTLAWLGLLANFARADEAETAAAFKKNRPGIEKLLSSSVVQERAAALNDLKQYPLLDAMKIAQNCWAKDPVVEVRTLAGEVLYSFRDDAKLRAAMFEAVKKEITEANGILAISWLAGAKAEDAFELLEPLGKMLEKKPAALHAFFTAVDFLGTRQDADAVKVLTALTKVGSFKKDFPFRRSVVMALIGVRHPDAITKLLELMPDADGETKGDMVQYLTRLSGQALGNDVAAWQTWWLPKKDAFTFPDPALRGGQAMLKEGQVTYYGIPIYAKKVIFVIDTSGSMAGPRIMHARAELIKAIDNLPSTTTFNIVSFNSNLATWNKQPVIASAENKTKATKWVKNLQPGGSTFTYDALKTTMDQQPEAMYVLTDGEPTGGAIVEPNAILDAIKQTNKYRRTTIHVIGVSPGPEEGVFSQFMKKLAAQNYGQYRRVD